MYSNNNKLRAVTVLLFAVLCSPLQAEQINIAESLTGRNGVPYIKWICGPFADNISVVPVKPEQEEIPAGTDLAIVSRTFIKPIIKCEGIKISQKKLTPGAVFEVTYYWRLMTSEPITNKHRISIHFKRGSKIYVNNDHNFKTPVKKWIPGELYVDGPYRLKMPLDTPEIDLDIQTAIRGTVILPNDTGVIKEGGGYTAPGLVIASIKTGVLTENDDNSPFTSYLQFPEQTVKPYKSLKDKLQSFLAAGGAVLFYGEPMAELHDLMPVTIKPINSSNISSRLIPGDYLGDFTSAIPQAFISTETKQDSTVLGYFDGNNPALIKANRANGTTYYWAGGLGRNYQIPALRPYFDQFFVRFICKITEGDLQTVSSRYKHAPVKNLLINGGLEFGMCGWIPRAVFTFPERGVRLDSNDPFEGKWCMAADNKDVRWPYSNRGSMSGGHILSNWFHAESGNTYYLSLAMKGTRNGQKVWFQLNTSFPGDPLRFRFTRKHVKLTEKWQVFTIKQVIPKDIAISKLIVEMRAEPGDKFYFDAAKVTLNAPADSSTLADDAVGVAVNLDDLALYPCVYEYRKAGRIKLQARNTGKTSRKVTVEHHIEDLFGGSYCKGEFFAELPVSGVAEKVLTVDTTRRGRFELITRVIDEQGKLVRRKKTPFVVMKSVAPNPLSPIAINGDAALEVFGRTLNDNLALLGRYGYSWVRLWLDWEIAEWEDKGKDGEFHWWHFDRLLKAARKNNLSSLCILNVRRKLKWREEQYRGTDYKNRNFSRWLRYVKATVSRYKDQTDLWEIQNEPSLYPPERLKWYYEVVKATYPVVKRIDPTSTVIACSPGDMGQAKTWNSHLYLEDFLKMGGVKYCDSIGLHPYTGTSSPIWGNLQGTLNQIQTWIKQSGGQQKVIMTEAGNFTSKGGYYMGGNDLGAANRHTEAWLIAWANRTQHYHHSLSAVLNSRRACYDPALIPNAIFCAANVLAELFNGSDYDSCRWLDVPKPQLSGIYGLTFTNGGDRVLAMWAKGALNKRLLSLPISPKKVSVTDLMGNNVKFDIKDKRPVITISSNLVYIRLKGVEAKEADGYIAKAVEIATSDPAALQARMVGAVQAGEMHVVGYKPPPAGPFKADKDGFVKDWLIMGPFANPGQRGHSAGFNYDFLKPIGGEATVRLRPGMSVIYEFPRNRTEWKPTPPRSQVKATEYHSGGAATDFKKLLAPTDYVVAYAYCHVVSPKAMKAKLAVGSDDGIKIWLNGIQVFNQRTYRGAQRDTDIRDVQLRKGTNRLMVKVDTDVGGWEFYLRFLTPDEKPLKNITVRW